MKLRPYHAYLELLVERFDDLRYTHLPKAQNQFVDALATLVQTLHFVLLAHVLYNNSLMAHYYSHGLSFLSHLEDLG